MANYSESENWNRNVRTIAEHSKKFPMTRKVDKTEYEDLAPEVERQYTLGDLYDSEYLPGNHKRSPVVKDLDDVHLNDLRVVRHLG